MYVLSGRLRLVLGDRDLNIRPGEAVEFTTWTPHWFGAVDGPVEAIITSVSAAPGERPADRRPSCPRVVRGSRRSPLNSSAWRENAELRRAVAISKTASAFFPAGLDRPKQ
jgi:uncharacterized cupin superfamily protein